MTSHVKALLVHYLTATGAVFAMLAMLAAVGSNWDMMFLWLVIAFFVDGIDGPLARHYNVKDNASEYDGVLLDLIIDYLTYVFIPAYALFQSGLLDGWTGLVTIIIITFIIKYHLYQSLLFPLALLLSLELFPTHRSLLNKHLMKSVLRLNPEYITQLQTLL